MVVINVTLLIVLYRSVEKLNLKGVIPLHASTYGLIILEFRT